MKIRTYLKNRTYPKFSYHGAKFEPWQIERDENGSPVFIHSVNCPGYCDYACNKDGIEQARAMHD